MFLLLGLLSFFISYLPFLNPPYSSTFVSFRHRLFNPNFLLPFFSLLAPNFGTPFCSFFCFFLASLSFPCIFSLCDSLVNVETPSNRWAPMPIGSRRSSKLAWSASTWEFRCHGSRSRLAGSTGLSASLAIWTSLERLVVGSEF